MTAAFTWPLVIRLGDSLSDWGDPADLAWRIGSILRQLTSDPLHLYQTNTMFPVRNELALDELITGQALLGAPIWWLTHNAPLTYNLLNFLSFTLSGWVMWLLVRRLTGNSPAGLVAGMIYAFSPWHYAEYGHLGLAAQQWMLLALFFLIRFLDNSRTLVTNPVAKRNWLNLSLFMLFFVLQALVAGYLAYFEGMLIGLFTIFYFLVERHWLAYGWSKIRRRPRKNENQQLSMWPLLCVAGAGLVSALIVLPFIWPFIEAQRLYHFNRSLTEVNYWSAAPTSFLRTTPQSWLYQPVQRGWFGLKTSPERALYPGLITLVLALIGIASSRRFLGSAHSSARKWFFVGITLFALILSFGPTLNMEAYGLKPTGIDLPYKWLYTIVPGFDALRVPYRFGQLVMLGLAVLAGYGSARLLQSKLTRFSFKQHKIGSVLVTFLLLSFVTADFFAPGVPITNTPTGANAPALYNWLTSEQGQQTIPQNALLLEVPLGKGATPINTSSIYLMYSLSHGRPMLNGSANIIPPGYDRLFNEMHDFPSSATLDIAESLGVKFIIVHTKDLDTDAARAELVKEASPGGRLKVVHRFPALNGDPNSKDAIYRLKTHPQRFAKLAELIPAGAQVFLGDDNNHHRLYTAILPNLIGIDRNYFSDYSTLYSNAVKVANPKQPCEYAIFYQGSSDVAAKYGYSQADLVSSNDNDIVQIYHKKQTE